MKLNNSIPIIFSGGHYGCYLQWVLNNFTHRGNGEKINYPFCRYGGCYHSYGLDLSASTLYKEQLPSFVAINPTLDIDRILNITSGNAILIEFNYDAVTSTPNNIFLKQFNGDLNSYFKNQFPDVEIDLEDLFQVRDFLSEVLFPLKEWDTSKIDSDRILKISLNDLIFNFELTLDKILDHCDTSLSRTREEVLKNHETMIKVQTQLSKDSNLIRFLTSVEEKENARFPPMSTIIDEAYVQRHLLEVLGLKIKKTYEKFPQTVTELRAYCYPEDGDPKDWPLGIDWEEDDDVNFGKDF